MTAIRTLASLSTLLLTLVLFLCAAPAAHAQQSQDSPTEYSPPTVASNASASVALGTGPLAQRMAERMARERNTNRQRKIVKDSTKLLALAKKLNAEMAQTNQNELSVAALKEASEIEKLAKSIKGLMSYGY